MERKKEGKWMKKIMSQVLSLLLVFVLVLGNTPIGQILVYASEKLDSEEVLTGIGEIISFEELSPEIAVQSVPVGADESELNLPDKLKAKVRLPVEENSAGETSVVTDSAISLFIKNEQNPECDGQEDTKEGKVVSEPVTMDIPVPVKWTSSPVYDGTKAGEYILTAKVEGHHTVSGPHVFLVILLDHG
jgi:hypothetical protein